MVAEITGARAPEHTAQSGHTYRFDWGIEGLEALAPRSAVVVVVDVLRFTTAVCCALEGGSIVLPFRWGAESAPEFARHHGAVLAGRREHGEPSLSPTDLLTLAAGTRLVLPSPNGSTISCRAIELGAPHVLAGCLRNASATARAAHALALAEGGGTISVIAAGERWGSVDGPLRPAVEDMLGAGAVLAALDPSAAVSAPSCSPEAAAARAAFVAARPRLYESLCGSASGRELLARGWEDDIANSAAHDVSTTVCRLEGAEFRRMSTG